VIRVLGALALAVLVAGCSRQGGDGPILIEFSGDDYIVYCSRVADDRIGDPVEIDYSGNRFGEGSRAHGRTIVGFDRTEVLAVSFDKPKCDEPIGGWLAAINRRTVRVDEVQQILDQILPTEASPDQRRSRAAVPRLARPTMGGSCGGSTDPPCPPRQDQRVRSSRHSPGSMRPGPSTSCTAGRAGSRRPGTRGSHRTRPGWRRSPTPATASGSRSPCPADAEGPGEPGPSVPTRTISRC